MKITKKTLLSVTISVLIALMCVGFGTVSAHAAQTDIDAQSASSLDIRNLSTINRTTVNAGEVVTLTSVPSGGIAPYRYKYYVRFRDTDEWIHLDKYEGKQKFSRASSRSGYYELKSVISDVTGRKAEKTFNVTVVKATGNKLINGSRLNKDFFVPGETVDVTTAVHGGTKPYKFTYYVKDANGSKKVLASGRMNDTFSYQPSEPGYYTLTVSACDRENHTIEKTLSYTVINKTSQPLVNDSIITNNVITTGHKLVVDASGSGGTAPYKYSYYYRLRATDKLITLSTDSNSSAFSRVFNEPGYYDFIVRVTDYNGKRTDKKLQFAVTKETGLRLENVSAISSSTVESGSRLVMKASAKGGKAPYRYRFYIQKDGGQWTRVEGYTPKDTYNYLTSSPGNYKARFLIADANNNTVQKDISFRVIRTTGRPCTVNITANKSFLYPGQNVTVSVKAEGGTEPYSYSFLYKAPDSNWTIIKDYSSATSVTATINKPGTNILRVSVKNGDGKIVSANTEISVISNTKLNVIYNTRMMDSPEWAGNSLGSVGAGTKAELVEKSGRWYKVYCNGKIGWIYNLAFNGGKNYSTITTSTLPAVVDDYIFNNGRDIRTLFNFALCTGYCSMNKDTLENMCVYILKYRRGACYQRAAILYYFLERAGYDVVRVSDGIDKYTGNSPHNWVIVKTGDGWRHIDPTPVIGLPTFYLVRDRDVSPYFAWDRNKYPACS